MALKSNEIIYITESSGYGGAESYLLDLATAAVKAGGKVSVAMPLRRQNELIRAKLRAQGINILELNQYEANYVLNFLLSLRFFRSHKNALFHFTLPYPDICRWTLLAASLLRRRFIISELLVPANPYRTGWYFLITHLLFNGLKRLSYSRADRVITICKAMKDTLVEAYGMPSEKIVVVYTGIDVAPSEGDATSKDKLRRELGVKEGTFLLTSAGRLAEQKGHTFLVAALERLVAEFPSLVLLLAGEGPLRKTLEAEVARRGLDNHVIFTGFREDFRNILSVSDLFVFPSLNEGFPYMVVEAMAAGNPVIATDVGGIPEAVVNGETGIMVPPKDVDALCLAIRSLLNDAARRREMGEKGRQRVATFFSREKMLQETFALYEGTA